MRREQDEVFQAFWDGALGSVSWGCSQPIAGVWNCMNFKV